VRHHPPIDLEKRREALKLADELSPTEASKLTGIPASTIRMWRTRYRQEAVVRIGQARVAGDPIGVEIEVEALRERAKNGMRVFACAMSRLEEVIDTAKNPQSVAIAGAIAYDKSVSQLQQALALKDRQVRVEQAQVDELKKLLDEVGLSAEQESAFVAAARRRLGEDVVESTASDARPRRRVRRRARTSGRAEET